MMQVVLILLVEVFASSPSTSPIITSPHPSQSLYPPSTSNAEPTAFACIIELIGPTTIKAILFGENLALGEYSFSIRLDKEDAQAFTLTFPSAHSSGISSVEQELNANYPLQPGHKYVLTALELNEPPTKRISFERNSQPVVIWLSVPPDTTTPVVSYIDLPLASDKISLLFEVYGVNLGSLTELRYLVPSVYSTRPIPIDISTHHPPYICLSTPIHPDDFFDSLMTYAQTINSIDLIDPNYQPIPYHSTVTAAQEDPATTMILTSAAVQFETVDETARFYLTGKHLVRGKYELSWMTSDFGLKLGSITLQFSTQTTASLVSDDFDMNEVEDLFDGDYYSIYRITPIDFGSPNPIVLPGQFATSVNIDVIGPWSLIPYIEWIECDLTSSSATSARIYVSGTGFFFGTYLATFSDDAQNQYSVQLYAESFGVWTIFSDFVPNSAVPSSTGLVYDAVYSDFKVYWNGIELDSQATSFTAPSASTVVSVIGATFRQVADASFQLDFMSNHVFSGTFEVTFTADGTTCFPKDIEIFNPPGTLLVESEVLEIDGSPFNFETFYEITSIQSKSDQTDILPESIFFLIPPARPTPVDQNSFVDLSGSEDLGCGYGLLQPCLNLVQAIHNQIVIPTAFDSYSPLMVKVRNGGIAKDYFSSPDISVSLTVQGEVDSDVVPTITIESDPQIVVAGGSDESASLTLLDLEFEFASVSGFQAFVFLSCAHFVMQRCVVTEATSTHSSFLYIASGDALIVECELKNIKTVDSILEQSEMISMLELDTVKVTDCGQSNSNSLFICGSSNAFFTKMDMAGCEAEDAPISLSSMHIFTAFTECTWTACKGSNFAGALSFSPSSFSTIAFHHCRWIDCSVNSPSQPTGLFIYRVNPDEVRIFLTNLTFESSDESQTRPHFLIHDVNLGGLNLDAFLFDYWTEPNMFLVQSDYLEAQPISSLSPAKSVFTVVAPTRNDEMLFGVDSPICGSYALPCATVGKALSRLIPVIGGQSIVSISDGGKAEFGTKIQNATICGEVGTARLVLLRHELSLDGTPFFTTSQATIESVVIDHSASTADVLIKHEQWHLEVSHVSFSTTATTSPTLISASAGTVALRFVSFDSAVFVSSAISIETVDELSIVSLSSFNTSFHSPLLTIRSLDPKISQASLTEMNVTNFSFGGSNELLIDARQATVLISECQFAGQLFVPSRCNSENTQNDLDFSLSANPFVGYLDSENQSRHPRNRMTSESKPHFSNSVCVWSKGGIRLAVCVSEISHCTFDSFASTALSLKGGTTLLSHSFFFGNGISSSLPTRRNVLVEIEGNVTIHNMTSDQHSNGPWISSDESSRVWRLNADSSERVPFDSVLMFRPVVESASLSGDEDKHEVVIVGESLIPCNLLVVLIATNTTNETSRPIECSDVWTEDGNTLRCSFDDTRMALSSLEWRVSVSCDGLEAWNMPVVRRAIRGDAKAEARGKMLISVSSVVFGVLGVIGVSLIISIVILSQKLKKTKATVTDLKIKANRIELKIESRRSRRTHRRRSLSQRSQQQLLAESLASRLSTSSSSSSHNSSVLNPIEAAIQNRKSGQEALDEPQMVGREDEATSDLNDILKASDPNQKSL
ncbi:hypothetical protein BLNAU_16493 [Blattamonas nauphoetae]|uniref:Membrane-associated protein n=1 Tax=Blattamonas nauphoetae TaxID=2049346 RepID=A0ABQ9XCL1_9EUKA|nr:hypothetical protein BLNAU_16493 [Blattamonas nauphoetae]